MSRRRIGAAGALLVAWSLVAVSCTGSSDGPEAVPVAGDSGPETGVMAISSGAPPFGAPAPERHTGPQGRVGQFVVECRHSHTAPDDPIVFPGASAMSHSHEFFGNETTDASSTHESLLGASTTCQNQKDAAAYWVPALLDAGERVEPTNSTAYYRAAPGVDPTQVEAFPEGLMIVAGDMTATAEEPQPADLAGWACGVSTRLVTVPPDCPVSAPLRSVITFPDCWNGEDLDTVGHRKHVANSSDGICPDTHPVHLPQLTFAVSYPISGTDHDLTLASGSTHGLHSDFINAWDQDELVKKVELCIHRSAVCGLSSNRGEDPLFSS